MIIKKEHPANRYPRINLSDPHRVVIYQEFPVSRQTVNDALKYHNNSETAQAIRKRALDLLREEVKRVDELIKQEAR